MTDAGGPAFWCSGGGLVCSGGRAVSPGRAAELLAWYAAASAKAVDTRVRSYLECRRSELALALEEARRWRSAAGASF